jgi:DNA polymerase
VKLVVIGWRKANPKTVQSWWDLQDAALEAVADPNRIVWVAAGAMPLRYMSDGNFLYCCLPSGRVMSYARPSIETEVVLRVNKKGEEYEATVNKVSYYGVDSTTRQWAKQYLYGGLQCENNASGMSRDIMVRAMFNVEHAGYPLVLTVHDELLSEVDKDFGSAREYAGLMSQPIDWAPGFPLAAAAWEDVRYVK